MAIWDFGPDAPHYTEVVTTEYVLGIPTLTLSGGQIDTNGKDGVAYTDAEGTAHIPGQGAAWDDVRVTGQDARWVMTIDTTGWWNLALRWDYKSEMATTFDFDYRIGAGQWNPILYNEPITADWSWHPYSVDLSHISAIENNPEVEFRLDGLARNGNQRFVFDNLEVTGVPEPTAILLLGFGGLELLRRRRR